MSRRSLVIDEVGVTAAEVVSAVPCGLVSVIFVGDAATASTLTLYDHATAASGNIKKYLAKSSNAASDKAIVYCPSQPDAFSNGIVAIVTGTNALACVSIEPV